MKKLLLALIGLGATTIATIAVVKWQIHSPPLERTALQSAIAPATTAHADEPPEQNQIIPNAAEESVKTFVNAAPTSVPSSDKPSAPLVLSQPLQTLVSRQATYVQKKAVWKQLRDAHQLDEVITDLEHAVKTDSSVAEYPALLGQAYILKLMTTEDTRDRGILALKADQNFDQALNLDPSNWEARFWKASSMSYWPASLNKSGEVIDNFVTLIEQQEKRPPQPHFAQTDVLLGEQYQKAGYNDYARETWQRGASLFPDNNTLREKLAGPP